MHPTATQRLLIVLAVPHRPFFLAGVIQFAATMGLWLAILCGWYLPGATMPTMAVTGMAIHAFLMLFGLFPFFVFGFAFTAFPRWVNAPPITRTRYSSIAGCMALGVLVAYTGFFIDSYLAAAGTALLTAGWFCGAITLYQTWWRSNKDGKRFALFPISCITAGSIGSALYTVWLVLPQAPLMAPAIAVGLWLFLVPLIVAVSHRMIPFFSSRVLKNYRIVKPGWTLPATLLCVLAHCILAITGQLDWSVFCDLPLAVLAAWHSWRWQLIRSLRVPLLGMLHIAFAWLSIAMALYAADSILQLSGISLSLGTAPLHALGIGYICSMVLAMATRVIQGHSGRSLVAGRVVLWAFALIQVTAVIRVLADCLPLDSMRADFILVAAALWLVAVLPWSLRNATITLTPRIDGRPG